ncbi:MAG: PorV/PorQ family protein [Promethearchaeota archaeon]
MNNSTKTILIVSIISILLLLNVNIIYPADYTGVRGWMIHPQSARAAGMGRGLVAIVDNANTVFWNPGGVTFLNGLNISYNYKPSKDNRYIDYKLHDISIIKKLKNKYIIGFNFRREYEYKSSGLKDSDIGISFGYNENSFGIGITTKFLFTQNRMGSSLKSLSKTTTYWILTHTKNPSFAVDIGILYSKNFNIKNGYILQFNFGSSLLNISKGIGYTKLTSLAMPYEEGIPRILRLGYAVKFIPQKGNRKLKWLTVSNNLEYSNVQNRDKIKLKWDCKSLGFGFEFAVYEILFFRIGYHYQKGDGNKWDDNYIPYNGYTYGFGVCLPVNYVNKSLPLSITYDIAQYPWDIKSEFKEERNFLIHSWSIHYNF